MTWRLLAIRTSVKVGFNQLKFSVLSDHGWQFLQQGIWITQLYQQSQNTGAALPLTVTNTLSLCCTAALGFSSLPKSPYKPDSSTT